VDATRVSSRSFMEGKDQEGVRGKPTHQLRRVPLINVLGRVPTLVPLAVLPQVAGKVVEGEEELLGGILVEGAEDAVVAHEGFESAA